MVFTCKEIVTAQRGLIRLFCNVGVLGSIGVTVFGVLLSIALRVMASHSILVIWYTLTAPPPGWFLSWTVVPKIHAEHTLDLSSVKGTVCTEI